MERPPTPAETTVAGLARSLKAGSWPGSALKSRYELKSVLASSGSCLGYLAWDHESSQSLVVKEFRPDALVRVDPQGQMLPLSDETAAAFERGLRAFVAEARALQQCDHPSLVRVLDVVEANGTAYQVMPRYRGRLLMDVRRRMSGPIGEPALRDLLAALLGAVEAYHQHGRVHGGIHPSQILLLEDDRPLLLGPGTAGRAVPASVLHPLARPQADGYAPPEQTHPRAHVPLGPWTDCFALAAVARLCIAGPLEPPAGLAVNESLSALVRRLFKDHPEVRYSAGLLNVLDAALSADIAARPQTARQFREQLVRGSPALPAAAPRASSSAVRASIPLPADPDQRTVAPSSRLFVPVPEVPAGPAAERPGGGSEPVWPAWATGATETVDPAWRADPGDRASIPRATTRMPGRSRAWWRAALVLAALGVMAVGAWQLQGGKPDLAEWMRATPAGSGSADSADSASAPGSVAQPVDAAPLAGPPATAVLPPAGVSPRQPPVPGAPPAQPTQTAATTPRQECGSRTQFALYRCMQLQCERTRWSQHPQCLQFAATDSIE